jgi:hypothetical protein
MNGAWAAYATGPFTVKLRGPSLTVTGHSHGNPRPCCTEPQRCTPAPVPPSDPRGFAEDRLQQHGLAAADRAHDGHELAAPDPQVDARNVEPRVPVVPLRCNGGLGGKRCLALYH